MGFDIALFDFDGTLADTRQCSILATRKTFKYYHLPIPSDQRILRGMGIPLDIDLLRMVGRPMQKNEIQELLATFRFFYQRLEKTTIAVFPHIPDVLETLKRSHVAIALVTSKSSEVVKRNVGALKLGKWLDTMICGDEGMGIRPKPAPDGVFAALRKLGRPSGTDAIVIGDAVHDIKMGHAAGVKTCAVTWGAGNRRELESMHPDYLLSNPSDLVPVILGWQERRASSLVQMT